MKIPLEELQKRITPLPWNLQDERLLTDGKPDQKDPLRREMSLLGLDKDGAAIIYVREDAAYIHHAANTLPELVEAIERAKSFILHASDECARKSIGAPERCDCGCVKSRNKLDAALTRAKSVEVGG